MADVLFSGGPCSGRHVHVSDESLLDGRITCGGMNYKAYPEGEDEWLALPPTHKPPPSVAASAPNAARAWRRLVHSIVAQVPADVRRSQQARRHLLHRARG